MTFLIDGYNLMHAEGYLTRKMPAKQFERRRGEFLTWLASSVERRGVDVLVVFDAKYATGPSGESRRGAVRVRFAYRQLADEMIEQLVSRETRPNTVTVVSNDGQVKDTARRRGCGVYSVDDFNDWLLAKRATPGPRTMTPEKPDGPMPPDEHDELLQAFSIPRPKRRGK